MLQLRRNLADIFSPTHARRAQKEAPTPSVSVREGGHTAAAQKRRFVEVQSFGSNPGNLRMLVYVPENLVVGAPLVTALHGCTQTASAYDHGAGWSTLAARFGFAVLLPEQKRLNNPLRCFNWFKAGDAERDRGEPLSIRQMVEWMIDQHDLDRSRVYITGLSAGGAMTSIMLATYPDVFAGGAIIAGMPYRHASNGPKALDGLVQRRSRSSREWGDLVRAASDHTSAWPKVSIWYGNADRTVRPINANQIIQQWTDVHGLSPRPSVSNGVKGHFHRIWRNSDGEGLIEAYTLNGMSHGAPLDLKGSEACGAVAPFFHDLGISSTYRIARFWRVTKNKHKQTRDARLSTRWRRRIISSVRRVFKTGLAKC